MHWAQQQLTELCDCVSHRADADIELLVDR